MENQEKVVIRSTISAQVSINVPELHFKRYWPKKGAKVVVDKSLLEELMYDTGVANMFKDGILYIDDMQVKKSLGLEPEDAEEPENIIVLTEAQMKRLLTVAPIIELKDTFAKVSKEQARELANYAITHELIDMNRAELIKQVTGINVLKAIELERSDREG